MTKESALGKTNKPLKDILLLFSIPIGIILVLIAFLYVPRLFASPAYDFIYCDGYYCDGRFSIGSDGNLQEAPDADSHPPYRDDAKLFYYDTQRDATRPLEVDEAARYRLDSTSKSPDGYILKRTSSGSGFLFWGSYSNGWSLSKGIVSKPISLGQDQYDTEFIGWVLE